MEFKLTVLKNKNKLQEIIDFFIAHKTNNYISHGEILDGRAIDFDTWSEDLESVLSNELNDRNTSVIIAEDSDQNIKGIMIVRQLSSNRQKETIVLRWITFIQPPRWASLEKMEIYSFTSYSTSY